MNEVVEIIYHWHKGNTIKGIKRSLKFDRKTIRKYIHMAQQLGVKRGKPLPDEQELIKGPRILSSSPSLKEFRVLSSWIILSQEFLSPISTILPLTSPMQTWNVIMDLLPIQPRFDPQN